ncbi:DNA-binding transcriptional MerR regulator [Humibacillus xanthopallidus]|uniref:DNA-binding transcriptional MerR regulator n=1 Tax=Humibacillus xanthopallidus TaxID=412689 RepID=A0A543PQ32_9MICO|nr:MerR family transcriptional regulator [Humibacillus xanthopallidus]TQN46184.1 DNA-binding transcriptional MerR regulator [Humibacillus xanthopallidus]
MLSIGDFARLAGVSVRMLRHYDALGLLRPARVDPVSGYRSYSAEQLDRANRLVALKDLGFTLEDCGRLLADDVPVEQLRGMLRLRRAELGRQIEADRARLEQVERRLRMIEKEHAMSPSFTLDAYREQALPAVRVVQRSSRVTEGQQVGEVVGPLFGQVEEAVRSALVEPVGPSMGHYTMDGDAMIAAAAYPVGPEVGEAEASAAGLELAELDAQPRALVTTLRGPLGGIGEAWQTLSREVESRGLSFAGPCREVYHVAEMDDPDHWVIELQQPVA